MLTVGSGPFAPHRGGTFNVDVDADRPEHIVYVEPNPKRVRGVLAGVTVLDSTRGALLHETAYLPVRYVHRDEVRQDLLEPSGTTTHCPFKGDATWWHLRVGDRVVPDAVWGYPEPPAGAPRELADLVAVRVDALDAWFEEDEEVRGHPRDPYTRVDTRATSQEVVVTVGGEEVARTRRAVKLFESNLPVRVYVPREDVRAEVLGVSATHTHCPYKGDASYHSVTVGDAGTARPDVAFFYPETFPEVSQVRGLLCFLGDDVVTTLDGAPLPG